MDFYQICVKEEGKKDDVTLELYPDFTVGRSKDLMVRGKNFYAIWDEERGLWSTDEYDVQRLVDQEMREYAEKHFGKGVPHKVKYLRSASNGMWYQFRKYMQNISDSHTQLDDSLTFANTEVSKSDHVSRRLPYPLVEGEVDAWNEIVGTLYSVEERAKIEWVIGAIVSGDAKKIQKFMVFYGPPGSGKSTILNIIQKLFEGYTTTFDAKALGSAGNAFATEVFRHNPLVAIQHDGDLSRIEDNARLNSIISHEDMPMNEKYKSGYTSKVVAFLLMGTNQPVKISDAKSGIIRRLIDVHPTGVKIPENHYHTLMSRIDFELGAIASHCLKVYQSMGKNYYSSYRPTEMMLQTDIFFNFIEANYDVFKVQDAVSLKQAYTLYKEYCSDTGIERALPQYKVRSALRDYFDDYSERGELGGQMVRSLYSGFNANKFKEPVKDDVAFSLVIDETKSLLDEVLADQPAQSYREDENGNQVPRSPWAKVTTRLRDLDSSDLHYVQVPENHIVIDFDLKDPSGEKSLERNLEAASVWPATYAELSKGGAGVHLHYYYDGDVSELSSAYSEGIEVKTLLGNASLRRRLSKCNNISISTYTGRLPTKEKKVQAASTIKSEKGLRDLVTRNLKKEIHPDTASSINFIKKILDDAYNEGMQYNLTDIRASIIAFAAGSSNQALTSMKVVQTMKFKSDNFGDDPVPEAETLEIREQTKDERLVFYDIEVYPNLFVVCWKYQGDPTITKMINPSAQDVEALFAYKLVGFNNRRYDNHILYGRYMGYNNLSLYNLSKAIIENNRGAMFAGAYGISYTDIYDFSSKKQGLKKFQIELGIPHKELDFDWDKPVDEEHWMTVVDYCCNDVTSTEAVFEARKQDFVARQVLADLSGLSVNDTTQKHTAKIIFGDDRMPQKSFVYEDLSQMFPGYEFDRGVSTYKGETTGEGGYVYAEPGMYENVALLDIASMHPTSIEQLNLFGKYTKNFSALKSARIAIKHKDYDTARGMLDGKLAPHLENVADADALSYALKIVINIVYGLTSAKFDNPFRDVRFNADNIVAKRGSLFMIDLKEYVQSEGFTVAHIKTDSIKIPNATPEIIEKVTNFGAKYGYDFEHEATYEKFCLVNDAVYVAKDGEKWSAVGAQFQHPYVYKTLFSLEDLTFEDMCETKQVTQGSMYLDFNHDKPDRVVDDMRFVGRTGRFVPVVENSGGAVLYRVKDGKLYAVTGTKGHLWMESDQAASLGSDLEVDMSYFDKLVDEAIKTLDKFGDHEEFLGSYKE